LVFASAAGFGISSNIVGIEDNQFGSICCNGRYFNYDECEQ